MDGWSKEQNCRKEGRKQVGGQDMYMKVGLRERFGG